ncbi:MAG: asparagine synthase (glutamine-hydrolyzing) [Accumulibacter sp.]|jgi:asparagine synthase (glutamine-hydrolysing)
MCGIVGAVGDAAVSATNQNAALESIRHRGPDGRGQYYLKALAAPVWLGHTRLSILDLSDAGHQPMTSRDRRWVVTFNGEIYNHLDLRAQLSNQWVGRSDTETLVEAISQWGVERALPKLNGMFAFAALDLHEGALHLVRDPFGIKPLYYSLLSEGAVFASEVKALTSILERHNTLDVRGFQTFLSMRFVPSPNTLFEGISRLQAGHWLKYSIAKSTASIKNYAPRNIDRFSGSMNDAAVEYRRVLTAAVQRQLLSDVPLGVLLSGGVDSALLAAVARDTGAALPCYSVGFGSAYSECELSDAEDTARTLGLPFHRIVISEESIWGAFESTVTSIEEPLGTTSVLPMWDLIKRARQDVTVVLTGQGSDEPWGGYRRYQGEVWREHLPFPGALSLVKPLASCWKGMPEHLCRALRSIPQSDRATRYLEAYGLFSGEERGNLTGSEGSGYSLDLIRYWLEWSLHEHGSGAEPMMRIDTRMGLADDLLLYADKISMAHSLEARVPMLDIELVRFVESLPLSYRVTANKTKIGHKIAAESMLPASIINRKKKGFQVPFSTWIRGAWKQRIESILLDPSGRHFDYLDKVGVQAVWDSHQGGSVDRGKQLFALTSFALWCDSWMSSRSDLQQTR